MRKSSFLFVVVIASQMGATKCGQVLRDPGFDLWCGEELCAWKTERGQVKRVPTWHEGDAGVYMAGTDVAIEQLTPVNSNDDTCIVFDLVANVDENSEVYFNVDIQGDGKLEMHERIPTSHWKPLSYKIRIKPPYDGIRFELTKNGTGDAVLANIGANTDHDGCNGLTELDPGPIRNGATCNPLEPTTCASGICILSSVEVASTGSAHACAGCDPAAPNCGSGEVCGLGDSFSPLFAEPTECLPTGSKEVGERCLTGPECASGGCFRLGAEPGRCSTCYGDGTCTGPAAGLQCSAGWGPMVGPEICGAGSHQVAAGQPCGTDDDCASGHCNGTVRNECDDGRPCISPADCPFGSGDKALQNGACTTVGIQGGTCQ
ncbi:MAG TPA: hypothetical protein VL326_01935 [Kofleriaceae bacterium]|nr:hypothetical protein [Kofleriaceae bacterium]